MSWIENMRVKRVEIVEFQIEFKYPRLQVS